MRALMLVVFVVGACRAGREVAPQAPDFHAEAAVEDFTLSTEDGATVSLHRHVGDGAPVLVVHGISSNHHSWDLSPERSVAVYLADRGHDVWLLDLRGHGDALDDPEGKRQWGGWSLDDYGRKDIPAAVDFVLDATGHERLGYVGHSLGGMVGAIYAGTHPGGDDTLSALIAVGSPMDFTDADPLMWGALTLARAPVPVLPTDLGGELQAMLGGEASGTALNKAVDQLLLNDIDPAVRPAMYQQVASPMTGGELRQLARSLPATSFSDLDGEVDYLSALSSVRTPTLVIAGRADQIAPVDRVIPYYERVGAEDKRLIIAGRYAGFAADYGHLDLTMGDHVHDEIYPLIHDWLSR